MTPRRAATLVGLATAVGLAAPLAGQVPAAVSARFETNRIVLGETVDLVIVVEPERARASIEDPVLPPMAADVVGRSRASQVSMSGTEIRRSVVFRIRLRPRRAGRLAVPPIRVAVDGSALSSSALALDVLEPENLGIAGHPWPDDGGLPALFVSARVDRERIRVGEQMTLTFAFYQDPRLPLAESPDYDPPETPGFWRVELAQEPTLTTERVAGRTYRVQRFQYALFPLRAGELAIGPAVVRVVAPDPVEWWRPGGLQTLVTDTLRIVAEPLPEGAPEGFTGSVGTYAVSAELPGSNAVVGVPIELEMRIGGRGNPSAIGAPVLPAWPEIDVAPPVIESTVETGRTVAGEATFRYLLSPRSEGAVDLGVARFVYFDPRRDTYVVDTLRLGEIIVRAAPRTVAAGSRERGGPTLWPAREPSTPRPWQLARRPAYWVALAAPWMLWLAATVIGRARSRIRDPRREAAERMARAVSGPLTAHEATVALRTLAELRTAWGEAWPSAAEIEAARLRARLEEIAYGGRPDAGEPASPTALLAILNRA